MPELNFQVEGAEPERFAAAPLMLFKLRLTETPALDTPPTAIQSVESDELLEKGCDSPFAARVS